MTIRRRSSLERTNDTAARHIQQHGFTPKGEAPIAPMPETPDTCRWCGGPLVSVIEHEPKDWCQRGCSKNESFPFVRQCDECRRDFRTGRSGAVLCHTCDKKDERAHVEGHKGSGFQQRNDVYARGVRGRRGEE